MTQNEIQNLKNSLKLFMLRHQDKNNSEIADLFLEEDEDCQLTHRSIRRYVGMIKSAEDELDADLTELEDPDEDENEEKNITPNDVGISIEPASSPHRLHTHTDPADVEEDEEIEYDFEVKYLGVTYGFTRQIVDRVMCGYSRKGLNMTTGMLQNVMGMSAEEIKAIISKLNISKDSEPYSEFSNEAVSPTQLYKELEENTAWLMERLPEHDTTVTGKLNKMYKKTVISQQQSDLQLQSIVEQISELLPKIKIEPLKPLEDIEASEHTHLIIPDMHIGMEQVDYNIEIVKSQLEYLTSVLDGCKNVHIHFLGDILHSVSGLNHKGDWKNMDPNAWGANAIIKPYKLILDFLSSIESLHSVNIVGGNHDRLQANWSDENSSEGAKLLAFMLNESIDGIEVKFDAMRIIDDTDPNLTVILLHGDKKVDNLPARDIAWNYGNPNKFNYIATGHLHCRKIDPKDDGMKYRKERLSAFCPQDTYGSTVANPAVPGVKMVATLPDNPLPVVVDIPLNYGE